MSFAHLHRHSEGSLLDGIGRQAQYVEQAVRWDQPAIGITDHGVVTGALEHYEKCLEKDVKPVLGMEAYFQPDLADEDNKKANHLVLHAKNWAGWQNLIRLSSQAWRDAKRVPISYKPIVDYKTLAQYSEGLICTTACMSSYPNQLILEGDSTGAFAAFKQLQGIFGDDLFVEIMPHDFNEQRILNKELVGVANELSLPIIATVDAHYPYEGWHDTHDIMLMVSTGQTYEKRAKREDAGEDVYKFECESLWLMPESEVRDLFNKYHPDLPDFIIDDSISNTMELVDRVSTFEISKANKMPKVDIDSSAEIVKACTEKMDELFGETWPEEYRARLEYEHDVMEDMGVLDYIYIIADTINWAREQGIRVGPGRGSSAGSLMCYLLGITTVDPIAYGMLFERFLNPERVSMPDIDTDFQSDRVGEVLEYLEGKYGKDKVAAVCAFQTFKPKAALDAISKVYDIPFAEVKKMTKVMDDKVLLERQPDLEECAEIWPEVAAYKQKYPEIWHHASRIEGNISRLTKHASAIVLMDRPINDFMPTIRAKDGSEVTGWSDKSDFPVISNYGMLKIDALSTDVLKVQGDAIKLVKERQNLDISLESLPIYTDPYAVDPRVMDAFSKGLVVGVWQFGKSPGFKKLSKNIKPENIFDIAAANALIRPGSVGASKAYINRKNGREEVEYFHPDAAEILERNYGNIIYQEDVMRISQKFGGFTGGEADTLRKIMGKEYRRGKVHVMKKLEELGYKDKFAEGAKEYGLSVAQNNEVWDTIINFGEYGFNLSHAVAYGIQSYQDMWLKVNFPLEFYTALITERTDIIAKIEKEAKAFDIRISPPDINLSDGSFTIAGNKILFGLLGIKGIGDKALEIIKEKRPFTSVEDFIERTPRRPVSKAVVEALRKAGAFDCFGERDLWDTTTILEAEQEILGIALSKEDVISDHINVLNSYIETEEELEDMTEGYEAAIGGEIDNIKVINAKNGREMAFIDVSYLDNTWSVTVFADQWLRYQDMLYQGSSVMVKGKKNFYNDRTSYIMNYCMPLNTFLEEVESE